MENIFRIIYDLSINHKYIDVKDLSKILEILVDEKELNKYILNIDVQQIRSNNLASYSNYEKKITVYSNIVDKMVKDIICFIKTDNELVVSLYVNLRILQVLLHEVEHANQEKIIYDNSLESFILRISQMVVEKKQVYDLMPSERFAEIKSFQDILILLNYNINNSQIESLIKNDYIQRKINGYHYCNSELVSPIVSYFTEGNAQRLLLSFEWYSNDNNKMVDMVNKQYGLEKCLFYGFPIYADDYVYIMRDVINDLNLNFTNKVLIRKK